MSGEKVHLVCFNPHCLSDRERCLTTATLHSHPSECAPFYYPVEEITSKPWQDLQKYPADSLGIAAKRKLAQAKGSSYIVSAMRALRERIEVSLKELEGKLVELYPQKELQRVYGNVYGLDKIADCLKLGKSPSYISSLVSSNFSAQNYHLLLRLNDNYDDVRNAIEGLKGKVEGNFDALLQRHRSYQAPVGQNKRSQQAKKINYGLFKSKFIASSKIEFAKGVVHFPKLANVASFLPWVYTDKRFNSGVHELKLSSVKYPLVQNAGLTVLEEHDIDTYPYHCFKSLFNPEGKGFALTKGQSIEQFVAETTVVVLRLELGPSPRAVLFDSEMRGVYECPLKENTDYRMGVYGCGWAMEIIELN